MRVAALVLALAPAALAVSATMRKPIANARSAAPAPPRHAGIAEHADYDVLRGEFAREKLVRFFAARPQVVAARFATVASTLLATKKMWDAQEALDADERDVRIANFEDVGIDGRVEVSDSDNDEDL